MSEARLEESILRILRLKAKLGLFDDPYVTPPGVDRAVGTRGAPRRRRPDRRAHARPCSPTTGGLLPLSRRSPPPSCWWSAPTRRPRPAPRARRPRCSPRALDRAGLHGDRAVHRHGARPGEDRRGGGGRAGQGRGGRGDVQRHGDQLAAHAGRARSWRPGCRWSRSRSATRTTSPSCRRARRRVWPSYSWTDVELRAAARVIAGRAGPRGRLPVPVQRADDPTQVLYPVGHGLSY